MVQPSICVSMVLLMSLLASATRVEASASTAKVDLEQYVRWLQEGGANFTKVMVTEIQDGKPTFAVGACPIDTPSCYRGVVALANIKEGELVISVPLNLSGYESDAEPRLPYPYEDASADVRLAAWLLAEKLEGEASEVQPFLAMLPKAITVPLFFTPEEVEELQFPAAIKAAKRKIAKAEEQYKKIKAAATANASLAHFQKLTLQDYKWASAILSSRMLSQSFSDGEDVFLIPLVDMLNHDRKSNVEWTLRSSQVAEVTATHDIAKGEQLFDYYSRKSWDEWIVQFGFTPKTNNHDYIEIFDSVPAAVDWYIEEFGIGASPKGRSKAPSKVERDGVLELGIEMLVNYADDIRDGAIFDEDSFRFIAENEIVDDELIILFATLWRNGTSNHTCHTEGKYEGTCHLEGPDIEHAARAVIKRCAEIQSGFPTTLAEDEGLLKDRKLSLNMQAAVRYRAAKKESMQNIVTGLTKDYKVGKDQIRVAVRSLPREKSDAGADKSEEGKILKVGKEAESKGKGKASVGKEEL